jgi:hypothetical protein
MLMAWKADHCVRDNAFAELLGMLSMLLLPEVGCAVMLLCFLLSSLGAAALLDCLLDGSSQ